MNSIRLWQRSGARLNFSNFSNVSSRFLASPSPPSTPTSSKWSRLNPATQNNPTVHIADDLSLVWNISNGMFGHVRHAARKLDLRFCVSMADQCLLQTRRKSLSAARAAGRSRGMISSSAIGSVIMVRLIVRR